MIPDPHICYSVLASTWFYDDAVVTGVSGWLTPFSPTLVKPWHHYDLFPTLLLATTVLLDAQLTSKINNCSVPRTLLPHCIALRIIGDFLVFHSFILISRKIINLTPGIKKVMLLRYYFTRPNKRKMGRPWFQWWLGYIQRNIILCTHFYL